MGIVLSSVFFFQAEDGIRARDVTGVQTCALPILLAVGILGATVMPHVIYLHSALLQDRVLPKSEEQARRLFRFTRIDVVIAMTLAGLIGRASCRERVWSSVVGVALSEKKMLRDDA